MMISKIDFDMPITNLFDPPCFLNSFFELELQRDLAWADLHFSVFVDIFMSTLRWVSLKKISDILQNLGSISVPCHSKRLRRILKKFRSPLFPTVIESVHCSSNENNNLSSRITFDIKLKTGNI